MATSPPAPLKPNALGRRGFLSLTSFFFLLNDVPHRVCSPSLSPHPPVVVLVGLWEGGRLIRCQGAGALLMPLYRCGVLGIGIISSFLCL